MLRTSVQPREYQEVCQCIRNRTGNHNCHFWSLVCLSLKPEFAVIRGVAVIVAVVVVVVVLLYVYLDSMQRTLLRT